MNKRRHHSKTQPNSPQSQCVHSLSKRSLPPIGIPYASFVPEKGVRCSTLCRLHLTWAKGQKIVIRYTVVTVQPNLQPTRYGTCSGTYLESQAQYKQQTSKTTTSEPSPSNRSTARPPPNPMTISAYHDVHVSCNHSYCSVGFELVQAPVSSLVLP